MAGSLNTSTPGRAPWRRYYRSDGDCGCWRGGCGLDAAGAVANCPSSDSCGLAVSRPAGRLIFLVAGGALVFQVSDGVSRKLGYLAGVSVSLIVALVRCPH